MNSFSYHAFRDDTSNPYNYCSRHSDTHPLLVNCTGRMELEAPFMTYNPKGREDYYLIYVISGELRVFLGDTEHICGSGGYALFPPYYNYKYSSDGHTSYLFVHFTGSFAKQLIEGELSLSLPYVGGAAVADEVVGRFEEIFSAFSADGELRDLRAGASLALLCEAILRAERTPAHRNRLSRSISYINSYFADVISIGELAEMESLSVSRYNTLFRAETSVSPVRYITELRMKHACSLLLSTDLDVGSVGRSVGYEDKHFFSKMFKKYVGVSAVEYRRKSRGE